MVGPTQEHGHTLDLVLSYGLPVPNVEICETVFYDHMPVVFDVALACHTIKPDNAAQRCRIINSSTAVEFSATFNYNCVIPETVCNAEELKSSFHSTCKTVSDTVAPLKTRKPKYKGKERIVKNNC